VTLRDKTALGISLPHRSPDPLALTTIGTVARRAEELGFRDLWVTENTGIHGTPEQVRERLDELVAAGANHLLLNPISRHAEQLEAVAELAGFK
jgi:alkanesulfonate monooxygenase SsuD/methylene tetrahydromethanopterin reductase-like flavin-dependent oxidoreductase (luciferase family)